MKKDTTARDENQTTLLRIALTMNLLVVLNYNNFEKGVDLTGSLYRG